MSKNRSVYGMFPEKKQDIVKRFFGSCRLLLSLIAIVFVLASGCSRHQQIVLSNEDGSHHLVYDADDFQPQAKTAEDIRVLMFVSGQIRQEDPQNVVLGMALTSAMIPIPDYKELERLIYNYKVAQLKNQK